MINLWSPCHKNHQRPKPGLTAMSLNINGGQKVLVFAHPCHLRTAEVWFGHHIVVGHGAKDRLKKTAEDIACYDEIVCCDEITGMSCLFCGGWSDADVTCYA